MPSGLRLVLPRRERPVFRCVRRGQGRADGCVILGLHSPRRPAPDRRVRRPAHNRWGQSNDLPACATARPRRDRPPARDLRVHPHPFGRDLAPGMLHRHTSHGEAVARIGWCVFEHRIGVINGKVGVRDRCGPRRARRPGSHETYDHLPAEPDGRGPRHLPPDRRRPRAALVVRRSVGDGQLADCATGAFSQNADDISGAPGSMLKTVAS